MSKIDKGPTVWLYVEDQHGGVFLGTGSFKEFSANDDRLIWEHPWTPKGQVRLQLRRNSEKWQYCYFGNTKEEAADKKNLIIREKIQKLEDEIDNLRKGLVTP
jgi:hypothetical protein